MEGYAPVAQGAGKQAAEQLLEQGRKKFGGIWKLLFFACACCTTAAGVLSIIVGVLSLAAPFDFINYGYLTLFGVLMFFMDLPLDNVHLRNYKYGIFHYALFLTRFVGRGVWYLFLSCMVVGALWDNDVQPFLGFILGGFIGAVSVIAIYKGIRLSLKLEDVRKKVLEQGPEQWGAYIPPAGMTKNQFKELAVALKGTVFTDEELSYIVAAFSFEVRSDDLISREEFEEWCNAGSMAVL